MITRQHVIAVLYVIGVLPCGADCFAGESGRLGRVCVLADGTRRNGVIKEIRRDWTIELREHERRTTRQVAHIVRWGSRTDVGNGVVLVLWDASLIVVDHCRLKDNSILFASSTVEECSLPISHVAGIVWHLPGTKKNRDSLLDRISALSRAPEGVLVLTDGTSIRGTIATVHDQTVRLQAGVELIDFDPRQCRACLFNPALARLPAESDASVLLGFRDGTVLVARHCETTSREMVIETMGGSVVTLRSSGSPLDALTLIQPLKASFTYVSDLSLHSYRHIPFLTLQRSLGVDRTTLGGRLRCRAALYDKGLGMVSASRVTYQLDRRYRLFAATLAIDDSAEAAGSVRYRVFVDAGDGQWKKAYESPVVRGGDAPLPIAVDIRRAVRLALLVDYADRVDQLDHANWLDARFVP